MEGFQNRLDQVFGGLAKNGAATWSVSGTQLERRRWRPEEASDEEDEGPATAACSSGFRSDEQPKAKRARDGDGEEGDGEEGDDEEDEMMRVGAMVGMDTTLDFEEEEDEYDKVAVGREGASDRFYTSDVKASFDSLSVLSSCRSSVSSRDNRAARKAAVDRLAEDDREAKTNSSGRGRSSSSRPRADGDHTDSRTKRKNESRGDRHRPEKRVRFAVEENAENAKSDTAGDGNRQQQHHRAGQDRYRNVPHHVRFPEKYTHYTLDWSEEGSSNDQAWQSTMAAISSSSKTEEEERFELPERIAFVPRASRERGAGASKPKETAPVSSVSFAAREGLEDESVVAMEEGSQPSSKGQRSRSYRSRSTEE